jgi:hypothetical protein
LRKKSKITKFDPKITQSGDVLNKILGTLGESRLQKKKQPNTNNFHQKGEIAPNLATLHLSRSAD